MPYRVIRFEDTPNPNAVKCVLDQPVLPPDAPLRSYRAAAEAEADPLARLLFASQPPGVITTLLITPLWITVNKAPSAEWPAVREGVRRALAEAV